MDRRKFLKGGAALIISAPTIIRPSNGALMSRITLTAPTSIYVSLSGNDANDGMSTSTPLRTIQAGIDLLANKIDPAGFQPTIQLIGGSPSSPSHFEENIELRHYLGSALSPTHTSPVILGDSAHPESYVVDGMGGAAILSPVLPMIWVLDGFTLQSSGGTNLQLDNTALVYGRNLRFGPCDVDILSQINSIYVIAGNYSIFGARVCHFRASEGKIVTQPGWTCTFETGASISWVFARAEFDGGINVSSNFQFRIGGSIANAANNWNGLSSVASSSVQRSRIETAGNGLPGVFNASYNDSSSYSN
jgi:hypothetical protein